MAASIALPSCVTIHASNPESTDCTTKECFLENEFGVESEGLQSSGAVVACEDGIKTAEEILRTARERYAQLHECKYSDPNKKLDSEVLKSFSHVSVIWGVNNSVSTTCAMVNQTEHSPCRSGDPDFNKRHDPFSTCKDNTTRFAVLDPSLLNNIK